MLNSLTDWLKIQILKHRENLDKIYARDKIDIKTLMTDVEKQSTYTLSGDALFELASLDALVRVANFLGKTPPLELNENMDVTEAKVTMYRQFSEEYFEWLKKEDTNYFPFKTWVEAKIKEGFEVPNKDIVFKTIQRSMFMWTYLEETNGDKKGN